MKIAIVFPGQGADLSRTWPTLRERSRAHDLLGLASELTGIDVHRALRLGHRELGRTEVLQPVLTSLGVGDAVELREAGVPYDVVLGLSLGEIAAWSAAGCIRAEDAVRLAAERGRLMGEAADRNPGTMVALAGCNEADVERALRRGQRAGVVSLAARNTSDEWVLSGERRALGAATRGLAWRELAVSGPWHSPAMRTAATDFGRHVERVERSAPAARFVANVTGHVTPGDEIPAALVAALTRPMHFLRASRTLLELGTTHVVLAGPPRPLRSLLRRNLGATIRVLDASEAIELDWRREAA